MDFEPSRRSPCFRNLHLNEKIVLPGGQLKIRTGLTPWTNCGKFLVCERTRFLVILILLLLMPQNIESVQKQNLFFFS